MLQAVFEGNSWNIALWTAQWFLCVMFLIAGVLKLVKSPAGLSRMSWKWAEAIPHWFIRLLALLELAGAIGIILPALLRIATWLSPLAALGMILVQLSAIVLHASRKETSETLWLNAILLAAAIFVVWGRM